MNYKVYKHMTKGDRPKMEDTLKTRGESQEIAEMLGKCVATIYSEMKRGLRIQRDANLIDRGGKLSAGQVAAGQDLLLSPVFLLWEGIQRKHEPHHSEILPEEDKLRSGAGRRGGGGVVDEQLPREGPISNRLKQKTPPVPAFAETGGVLSISLCSFPGLARGRKPSAQRAHRAGGQSPLTLW